MNSTSAVKQEPGTTKPEEKEESKEEESEKIPEPVRSLPASSIKEEDEQMDDLPTATPRQAVLEVLQQAETSGSFCVGGDCVTGMTMPGLHVDGIGHIGLPLSENTALALLEKSDGPSAPTNASVGLTSDGGPKTISASKCSFENPVWKYFIQELAHRVCYDEMEVKEEVKIEAAIHTIVLAETGTTTLRERDQSSDAEVSNAFGTLMVTLPSIFEGGDTKIQHAGSSENISHAEEAPFKTQYVAFYNDCQTDFKPITKGRRLCVVYDLVSVSRFQDDTYQPSASENNRQSLLKRLREVVPVWQESFDGSKLVIMNDHVKNEYGSKFQGDDEAIVQLLKLSEKQGVGLDWARGTVRYRIYGYGCGASWMGYEWNGTETSIMALTLTLRKRLEEATCHESQNESDSDDELDVDLDSDSDDEVYDYYASSGPSLNAATEMIPSNFFDSKTFDETFKSTYHGVTAKRTYANESAIVVWPRAWRWKVLAGDDLSKMCTAVLRTPDVSKAKLLSELILTKKLGYDRTSIINPFMKVLIAVQDHEVAVKFWGRYLEKQRQERRVPNEILSELRDFMSCFGSGSAVQGSLVDWIQKETLEKFGVDDAISFVCKCAHLLLVDYTSVSQRLLDKLVISLGGCNSPIKQETAETFFALFQADNGLSGAPKLVSTFLDEVTRSSCDRHSKSGPIMLLGEGLSKVFGFLEWKGIDESFTIVINKLIEYGSVNIALKLVKELIGPVNEKIDKDGNKYRFCSKLVKRTIGPALQSVRKKPTIDAFLNLFYLAQSLNPSSVSIILDDVMKLDVDQIILPLIIKLHKKEASPHVEAAVSQMAQFCSDVLLSRLAIPMKDRINWSLPLTLTTTVDTYGTQRINAFLCSPCKGSYAFELVKHSHEKLLADLRPLVASGHINAYPSRPSGVGRWNIKIDKLQNQSMSVSNFLSLTCHCSSHDEECVISDCETKVKQRQKEETMLEEMLEIKTKANADGDTTLHTKRQQGDSCSSSDGLPRKKAKKEASCDVIVID